MPTGTDRLSTMEFTLLDSLLSSNNLWAIKTQAQKMAIANYAQNQLLGYKITNGTAYSLYGKYTDSEVELSAGYYQPYDYYARIYRSSGSVEFSVDKLYGFNSIELIPSGDGDRLRIETVPSLPDVEKLLQINSNNKNISYVRDEETLQISRINQQGKQFIEIIVLKQ